MTKSKHCPSVNKALIDDLAKEEKGIRPEKPRYSNWELQFLVAELVAILLFYFGCEYGTGVSPDTEGAEVTEDGEPDWSVWCPARDYI